MKHAVLRPLMSSLASCLLVLPCAAGELEPLKLRYLACAHESAERRLAAGEAAACSQTGDELLKRGFAGDLDRLLAWWRLARQPPSFDQAQLHYEAGHYGPAYAAFAALADCGHREAARIALQMRQFGPALYGTAFMAGPRQLQRWRSTLERPPAPEVERASGGSECGRAGL